MFENSWSVPPQVDVDGHSPSQVLILHIVDSFLRLPAVAVPERLHYKRRIYNSRRLCHETLVMDVATQQRTLPNIVEHYRASPIMSGDVGYGCRGDEAVGDWNFK